MPRIPIAAYSTSHVAAPGLIARNAAPGTRGGAHVRVAADPDGSNSAPERPSSAAAADVATFNHMAAKTRRHRHIDLKARRRGRASALTLANVENGPLTSPQIVSRATHSHTALNKIALDDTVGAA